MGKWIGRLVNLNLNPNHAADLVCRFAVGNRSGDSKLVAAAPRRFFCGSLCGESDGLVEVGSRAVQNIEPPSPLPPHYTDCQGFLFWWLDFVFRRRALFSPKGTDLISVVIW